MVRQALIRCQAVLLAIALVAMPLVLLARPSLHAKTKCDGMCCRPRKSHAMPARASSDKARLEEMDCHRGAAKHLTMCLLPSSPHREHDVVAPLPPALLLELDAFPGPQPQRTGFSQHLQFLRAGFAPPPFEPPRSCFS